MNKRESYAMMFATLSFGLLWLYVVLVLFLGRSIGGRDIGLGLIALSLPFAVGVFYIVIRTAMVRGLVSSKHLINLTLVVCVSLGSCLLYTSDAADDLLCVDLGG